MTTTPEASAAKLTALMNDYASKDLFPVLLRLLAEGQPVERARIARAAGLAPEELDQALKTIPTGQWDSQDRLIGMGITLVPTPHRFIVEGIVLYTWCATDALVFPAVIGKPALVESACPVTGAPIRLEVHPARLGPYSPPSTVVSRDLPRSAVADIRTSGCVHGHFFASEDATADWRAAHPSGTVLSVEDEFAAGLVFLSEMGWADRDVS